MNAMGFFPNLFAATIVCTLCPCFPTATRFIRAFHKMQHALLIYGGWEGHSPQAFANRMTGVLSASGFSVDSSDSLDVLLDSKRVGAASVIIPIWTMGSITQEQFTALKEAVASGTGLAGWHGGMCDAFRQHTDYQFLTGGQFVAHPGNIRPYTVQVLKDSHPITEGIEDFEVVSEQYYMHVDPSNQVLATTTFDGDIHPWIKGTVMPVVWTRSWDKGRVFFSSIGHAVEEFDVPGVLEITRRGILWAAKAL